MQVILLLSTASSEESVLTWSAEAIKVTKRPWDVKAALKSRIYQQNNGGFNDADIKLLGNYYHKANSIMEYGIGESTLIATYVNVSRYTGVDSDPTWIDSVRSATSPRFRFVFADIGPIVTYGFPFSGTKEENSPKFPFYSIGPLAAEREGFDFYMVNGRFRVACVCAAMLHASRSGRAPDTYHIGLNGYKTRGRREYLAVKSIAKIVDGYKQEGVSRDHSAPHIAIFRRKEGVTDEEIYNVWEEYRANPVRTRR